MSGFLLNPQQLSDSTDRQRILGIMNNLKNMFHIPNSIDCQAVDRLKSQAVDRLKSKGYDFEIVHPGYLDKFGSYPEKPGGLIGELTVPCVIIMGLNPTVQSLYDHLLSPPYLFSDPGNFHFADKFNPNYKGAADRFRSDSTYKEAIQNTGMSGASSSKGKDGEPTKDDERTLAWKLRLSAEAVTPKFNASANLNLEMKSCSGSNSKPPPLPPMATPLACKLYDCLLGCKKKFID